LSRFNFLNRADVKVGRFRQFLLRKTPRIPDPAHVPAECLKLLLKVRFHYGVSWRKDLFDSTAQQGVTFRKVFKMTIDMTADTYGLIGIADEACLALDTLVNAQDKFRERKFHQADIAIDEVKRDVTVIEECLDQLEATIPKLINRPKAIAEAETDYCNALGDYLCDLLNSMNAYLHLLRVQRASYRRFSLVKAWRASLGYRRSEIQRLKSGRPLMSAYSIYNIALHAKQVNSVN